MSWKGIDPKHKDKWKRTRRWGSKSDDPVIGSDDPYQDEYYKQKRKKLKDK
jgi:hypothetical protein